jgi:hypothetical protein
LKRKRKFGRKDLEEKKEKTKEYIRKAGTDCNSSLLPPHANAPPPSPLESSILRKLLVSLLCVH